MLRGSPQEPGPGALVVAARRGSPYAVAREPMPKSTWPPSPRQTRSTQSQRVPDRVDVDVRVERAQPLLVDQWQAAPRNSVGLAVEHHPDVDELLPVDAGDAAQHDVLVGPFMPPPLLPAPRRAAPSSRARRKATYAARSSSGDSAPGRGSSHSSGTAAEHVRRARSSSTGRPARRPARAGRGAT